MGFGLSLVRFALGIAALWLIATAYQAVATRMAQDALASASDPQTPSAFQFKRVDLSNCQVGLNGPPADGQGGCNASGPQGAIPRD